MSVGSDNWNGEMLEPSNQRGVTSSDTGLVCLLGNWIIIHRDGFTLKEIFHQRTCSYLINWEIFFYHTYIFCCIKQLKISPTAWPVRNIWNILLPTGDLSFVSFYINHCHKLPDLGDIRLATVSKFADDKWRGLFSVDNVAVRCEVVGARHLPSLFRLTKTWPLQLGQKAGGERGLSSPSHSSQPRTAVLWPPERSLLPGVLTSFYQSCLLSFSKSW